MDLIAFAELIDMGPQPYPPFPKAGSKDLAPRQSRSPSVLTRKSTKPRPASPAPSSVSIPSIEFHGLENLAPLPLNGNGATKQRRNRRHHHNGSWPPPTIASSSNSRSTRSGQPTTGSSRRSRNDWLYEHTVTFSSGSRSNRSDQSTSVSSRHSRPDWADRYVTACTDYNRYTRGNQDIIDSLDHTAIFSYHHEGPYDALSRARNRNQHLSPLQALENQTAGPSNQKRKEDGSDSPNSHRPLPSQPLYPPGTVDREGRVYDIEEGANLMFDTMRLPGYVSWLSSLSSSH